jgi:hypothetical protein
VAIYKTKTFDRFARSESINDEKLTEAVSRAGQGLIDADLGGGLIKQRVAREGQGRRGGYRVIIALRKQGFVVFLFGYAKSAVDNLDDKQTTVLQGIAARWLNADAATLRKALEQGELLEVLT